MYDVMEGSNAILSSQWISCIIKQNLECNYIHESRFSINLYIYIYERPRPIENRFLFSHLVLPQTIYILNS